MKFMLSPSFQSLFPYAQIGIFCCKLAKSPFNLKDDIQQNQSRLQSELLGEFSSADQLSDLLPILDWRSAYTKFGANPKMYIPTHEAFLKRLIKQKGWPSINPIVDAYLLNQARTRRPHGGYDLTKIKGDLLLDVSCGNEEFTSYDGKPDKTSQGEVVYRDKLRVLTRRWNYCDSVYGAIDEQTTSFVIITEYPSLPLESALIFNAISLLKRTYQDLFYCSEAWTFVVQGEKCNTIEFPEIFC
jgi:DNA/RNA-binding domain of Phe-tRNA-synthetase-like protein